MINIKEITWRNFLGYGDYTTSLNFNDVAGVCLVEGEVEDDNAEDGNEKRNGAGKSTIVEAIIWCLFGNLTRKENPGDRVINWFSKKNCMVCIKTEDGYEITRTRKFDIGGTLMTELLVMKDGEDLTRSTKIPAQNFINKHFNIFYHTCIRMNIFSQFSTGFMELSETKMRRVMERLLQIDNLSPVATTAKSKLQGIDKDIEVLNNKIESCEDRISEISDRIEDLKTRSSEFKDDIKSKISAVKESMAQKKDEVTDNLKEIKSRIAEEEQRLADLPDIDIDVVRKEWSEYNDAIKELETKKESLKDIKREKESIESILKSTKVPELIDIDELSSNLDHLNKLKKKLATNRDLERQLIVAIDRVKVKAKASRDFCNNPPEVGSCSECMQEVSEDYVAKKVDEAKENLEDLENKITEGDNKLAKLASIIKKLENDIDNFQNLPSLEDAEKHNKDANESKKAVRNNKNRVSKMSERINELEAELEDCNIELPETSLEEAENHETLIHSMQIGIDSLKEESKSLTADFKSSIKLADERIKELQAEKDPYLDLIDQARNESLEQKEQKEDHIKKLNQKKTLKAHVGYIKESYGNKRKIKAFWISELIPEYNKYLKYYLDFFEVEDTIEFDELLVPKMNRWGYETHSGGECKRIDLSMMFALNDLNIATFGPQANFMALDEVDGRLDPFTINKLVSLLSDDLINRNNGLTNIFVISHRDEMKDRFPNKIRVKNKQERSYIING